MQLTQPAVELGEAGPQPCHDVLARRRAAAPQLDDRADLVKPEPDLPGMPDEAEQPQVVAAVAGDRPADRGQQPVPRTTGSPLGLRPDRLAASPMVKPPLSAAASGPATGGGRDRLPLVVNFWDDGHGLWPALGILLDPVGHPLTSRKGAAPDHKYRGKVDEGILPTVIWSNEAEPLDVIELLDDSGLPLT
jgi:hypothetical protein